MRRCRWISSRLRPGNSRPSIPRQGAAVRGASCWRASIATPRASSRSTRSYRKRDSSEPAETPSEEWLRDNHYVVRAQLLEIRRNLPRQYYEELPTLVSGRWRRYPRVYVFARSFVTHTAGRFDQELLRRFADAYQDVTPLTIGELWAIPIMLRLALVENLCGLAVQTLRARQDRDAARQFAAELLQIPETERRLRQLTDKASSHVPRRDSPQPARPVGRVDRRVALAADEAGRARPVVGRSAAHRAAARGHRSALHRQHHQHHARAVGARLADVCRGGQPRRSASSGAIPAGAYADMDRPTRDRYRKSVEQLSRRSGTSELDVAERAIAIRRAGARRAARRRSRTSRRVLPDFARPVRARAAPSATRRPLGERISRLVFSHPAIGYLGTLAVTTALFETSLLLYARNNGASPWMIALVALVTRAAGVRAGAQLPEHDSDHADSAAAAAEARAAQRRARRAADGRRGADDSVVGRRA